MELKEQKTGGFGIIQKNEDGTISQIGLTESQYTVFEIFLENLSPVVRLPEEFNLTTSNRLNTSEKRNIFNEGYSLGIKSRKRESKKNEVKNNLTSNNQSVI